MRRGQLSVLLISVTAIGLMAAAQANSRDWLIYNATPSVPRGWYVRSKQTIQVGVLVTVRANEVAPDYAATRDFTDAGDRFIKRVAATEGALICAEAESVSVGAETFPRTRFDSSGRALPTWEGCHALEAGEVFLIGDTGDSFDSRYFGIVRENQIEGVWRPL